MEGAPIAYKKLAESVLAVTPLYLCPNPKDRADISRSVFLLFCGGSLTILRKSREKKGKGSNEERIQFDTISCDIRRFPRDEIPDISWGPVCLTVPQFHVDMPAFLASYNGKEGVTTFLARLPSPSDWEERKEDREDKTLVYVSAWYRLRQRITDNKLRQLTFLTDQRHFVTFHTKGIFQWCLEVEDRYIPILPVTEPNTEIVYGGTYGHRQLVFSVAEMGGHFHLYTLDMSMAMTFGADDLIPVEDDAPPFKWTDFCETIETGPNCLFWWKHFDKDYVLCLESKYVSCSDPKDGKEKQECRVLISIRKIESSPAQWRREVEFVLPISFGNGEGARQLAFPCDPCDYLLQKPDGNHRESTLKCCVGVEKKLDEFEVFTVQFKKENGGNWKEDSAWQATINLVSKAIHKCRQRRLTPGPSVSASSGTESALRLLTFVRFLEKERSSWNQLLALHNKQLYQIHPPAKGGNG